MVAIMNIITLVTVAVVLTVVFTPVVEGLFIPKANPNLLWCDKKIQAVNPNCEH